MYRSNHEKPLAYCSDDSDGTDVLVLWCCGTGGFPVPTEN